MKKLTIFLAALLACSMSFAATVVKTTSFAFGRASNGCDFNSASVTYTDAANMAWTMSAVGMTSFSTGSNYNLIGTGTTSTEGSVTMTGVAPTALNITSVSIRMQGTTDAMTNQVTISLNGEGYATGNLADGKSVVISGSTAKTLAQGQSIVISIDLAAKQGIYIQNITYTYEVQEADATGISLNKSTISMAQYKRDTLKATLVPAEATTDVVWTSSDENVATVTDGIVYATGIGTANITATAGSVSAQCAINVIAATPLTVAQAIAKANTVTTYGTIIAGGKYVIRGYVKEVDYSMGRYRVWLVDSFENQTQEFYGDDVKIIDGITPVKGSYVEIVGDITRDASNTPCTLNNYATTIKTLESALNGTYTIGTSSGCHYSSLYDAFEDYNTKAAAGKVTGDVTFRVATDLTETKNVGIQNPTDYTVTLTSGRDATTKVSFTQTAANAGPAGNICIGCDNTLTHQSASVASKNIVIDGSYNGDDVRHLYFKSAEGSNSANFPITVYGNVQNVTIKTCAISADHCDSTNTAACVSILCQKDTTYAPSNINIINTFISTMRYKDAYGSHDGIYVGYDLYNGKKAPSKLTISDNSISTSQYGIKLTNTQDTTFIKGNKFSIVVTQNGKSAAAISGGSLNNNSVFVVDNNVIEQLASVGNIYGIQTLHGIWYIRNNFIAGFEVAPTTVTMKGVAASAADSAYVYHNTIALADQSDTIADADHWKVCLMDVTSTAIARNNLLYSAEKDFINSLVKSTSGLRYNVYCTSSYVGTMYKDFKSHMQFYEPTAKQVSNVLFNDETVADLVLIDTSDGDINLGVQALPDVPTDIYGTKREAYTYAGAYQATPFNISMALNKTAITSMVQYKRDTLSAIITPTEVATATVTWSSSDEKVATVEKGVVYAEGLGTAKIYATIFGKYVDSCTVTVTTEATPLTVAQAREIALALQPKNWAVAQGGKYVVRGYVRKRIGSWTSQTGDLDHVTLTDSKDGAITNPFYTGGAKVINARSVSIGDYIEVVGDIARSSDTICTMSNGATIRRLSMPSYCTIGTTEDCDYQSLYDAFNDYNTKAAAGLVVKDVTFFVETDLTEPKNVGLQNPTEYTVTLSTYEAHTITFTQESANAGCHGNICIGCDSTLSFESTNVASQNIVIDGGYDIYDDYDVEIIGFERRLTFKSAPGSNPSTGPIAIYGNVKNVTIKRCASINAANGSLSNLDAIYVGCPSGSTYAPSNILIQDNIITSSGKSGKGIRVDKGVGKASPSKVTILNNEISAKTYGLYFDGVTDTITIKGNTIKMAQEQYGTTAICCDSKNITAGKVFVIENNTISQLRSAGDIYGIRAQGGKMYIRNNYISGFDIATTPTDSTILKGISIESTDSAYIEHNTIALADMADTVKNKLENICLLSATNKCRVQNNLFYSAETDFRNALVNDAGVKKNNVYCTSSAVSTRYVQFPVYKGSRESTAKSVDSVTFVDLANGNLDLTGNSIGDNSLSAPLLSTVPTDIHGTVREEETYAGAFQGKSIIYVSQYNIIVNCDAALGTVTGGGIYNEKDTATLTPIANEHYHFTQWSDGNTDNPRKVIVTADATYRAEFAIDTFTVTLTCDAEQGTVTGGGKYTYGEQATLTAIANEGYTFSQWSDGNTYSTRTIFVTSDVTYSAQFTANTFTITTTCDETQGTVTGGGIYNEKDTATLTPIANEHYHFTQWSDGNTDNPRKVIVTADATYRAEFAIDTFTVTLTCDAEQGTVTGGGKYTYGEQATLTATANEGYTFSQWSDGNTETPRTITVEENITLEALFVVADALDNINSDAQPTTQKVIRNGQVYILRGDKTYTTLGQEVK